MHDLALIPLLISTWQTIYMVFISSFLSIFFGVILGVVLFFTKHPKLAPHYFGHNVVGFIVNVFRSIPFIILMIVLLPLTRLLVGTSIGVNAAIVPLAIAAIPFYARVSESAFLELPNENHAL